MSDLSTAGGADIGSLIGALELGGHVESYGDGVLESCRSELGLRSHGWLPTHGGHGLFPHRPVPRTLSAGHAVTVRI